MGGWGRGGTSPPKKPCITSSTEKLWDPSRYDSCCVNVSIIIMICLQYRHGNTEKALNCVPEMTAID